MADHDVIMAEVVVVVVPVDLETQKLRVFGGDGSGSAAAVDFRVAAAGFCGGGGVLGGGDSGALW
jgi:hypothetical protein